MQKFEDQIHLTLEIILNDYRNDRTIDKIKNFDLPDNAILEEILGSLKKIIFPGYFRSHSVKIYTVRNQTSMLLEDVIYKLSKQIAIVLRYDPLYEIAPESEVNKKAQELTLSFFEKIPKIREYIETDVQAAFEGDPAAYNKTEIIYSYPGLFAIFVNRIAHELHLLKVPMIPRIMTEYAHSRTGIDIHPGASIG
ncbi:MAG: serine acetyltransferase, partial [Oscillospiraceae bacterium]|nr:serine acetyltransferase [Oscillospiraceae bacterium]